MVTVSGNAQRRPDDGMPQGLLGWACRLWTPDLGRSRADLGLAWPRAVPENRDKRAYRGCGGRGCAINRLIAVRNVIMYGARVR
jgi:hypothetical protein